MRKSTYFVGTGFVGLCMMGALFCLVMVLLGLMGLESDRAESVRGLLEMLLVGVIFLTVWTVCYRLSNRKPPEANG